MIEGEDKISKALIYLMQSNGAFYAELFIRMIRIEGKETLPPDALLAVLPTNGRIYLYTDVNRLKDMSIEQVAKGLEHEALHIVMDHASRRCDRNPLGWNYAGDLAINSLIKDMDIGLIPGKGQFANFPKMKSAEEYFELLKQMSQDQAGKGSKCNSHSAHGKKAPGQGEGEDQETSDFDKEVMRKAAQEAKDSADKYDQRGRLPGDIEKIVNDFLRPPTVNWKQVLRQKIAATVKANTKRTWRKENRRKLDYLKGKMKDRILRVTLVLDTSGSIFGDPELLSEFYGEINGIQKVYNSEMLVIECDAMVANTYTLRSGQRPNPSPKGGGGTSFRPPYQWLAEHKKTTDVVVYLTDLYGDFPEKEPVKTIWCVCPGGADKVPWGQIVKMTPSAKKK
jgi:predicted metal-dependent peptidase